jgi:hypothetical protein
MILVMIDSCDMLVILSAAKDLGCEWERPLVWWPDPSASPQHDIASVPRTDSSESVRCWAEALTRGFGREGKIKREWRPLATLAMRVSRRH